MINIEISEESKEKSAEKHQKMVSDFQKESIYWQNHHLHGMDQNQEPIK